MKHKAFQRVAIGIVGFILIVLITACAGVSTGGQPKNFTGSLASVNAQLHSVMLNVNGQLLTFKGLTDQDVAALQAEEGKISSVSIQATQNSDGSYTIASGQNSLTFAIANSTSITSVGTSSTPGASGNVVTSGANEPGSISFTGSVTSVSSSSIAVSMPDGSTLTMIINAQTDMSDFKGVLPTIGQLIKVEASANTSDGSLTATKLKSADSSDNTVVYTGVTTSAVGADNVIHFRIGNRDFSFTVFPGTTKLDDFDNNPQSIGSNVSVQVKVQFQGTTETVQEVKKS